MIDDLIRAFRDAGLDVPQNIAKDAEVQIRRQYGGERVYVASLPKQRRQVQLAKLEKMSQIGMAKATGLNVRHVRLLLKGK